MAIGNILLPFVTFRVYLLHFSGFWYHITRKLWQPRFPLDFFQSDIFRHPFEMDEIQKKPKKRVMEFGTFLRGGRVTQDRCAKEVKFHF
jgi:hypothetical protein